MTPQLCLTIYFVGYFIIFFMFLVVCYIETRQLLVKDVLTAIKISILSWIGIVLLLFLVIVDYCDEKEIDKKISKLYERFSLHTLGLYMRLKRNFISVFTFEDVQKIVGDKNDTYDSLMDLSEREYIYLYK